MNDTLIEVENLKQYFHTGNKGLVKAVNGVSFHIKKGEVYGLVGESGSGKSTIGRDIIRLYSPSGGSIRFNGINICKKMTHEEMKSLRTGVQMIFQDPMASLNPRKKAIEIVSEGLEAFHLYSDEEDKKRKVLMMLDKVGISAEQAYRYPHQFSGGQRQRLGIARALVMNPRLIIADEAISALDVSIQAQIVNLLKKLQKETGVSMLFIAHDLAMVRYISDRIGVLHLGYILETGTSDEIFRKAVHPYTRSLLSSIPIPDPQKEKVRLSQRYDHTIQGIDYEMGSMQKLSETHYVRATKDEFDKWTEEVNVQ